MATAEQPITRPALREELDRTLEHYVTKADLYKGLVQVGIAMIGVVGVAVAFLTWAGSGS